MRKIVLLLVLFLLGAFCGRQVLANAYFGSHDGDYMLIRAYIAEKSLAEGQLPLRWSGSLQYGCGAPVFNFFYPLFGYLVGGAALLTRFPVSVLMKWLYFSFFIVGPIGMLLWIRHETKDELAGFLGGILYLFAPYRFVLVFVRGSIEGLGYALLPWVFLAIKLVYEKPRSPWRWAFAIFVGAAFFLSHNLVVFFSLPLLGLYILYLSMKGKLRWGIFLVFFWTVLTLFFWGPALLEQSFTKLPQQVPQILENLPTIKQLIYSPWDFGPTHPATATVGYPTGISFSVGLGQWLMLTVVGLVTVILFTRKRHPVLLWGALGLSLTLIFLDSNLSRFVWKVIPFLGLIQFPWRLLGFIVLLISLAGGVAFSLIKGKWLRILVLVCVSLLAYINVRNYMGANPAIHPEIYTNLDQHFFRHTTTSVSDEILPPHQKSACPIGLEWIEGDGVTLVKRTYGETGGEIIFSAIQTHDTNLTLPLSYFPGIFDVSLNGNKFTYLERDGFVFLPKVHVTTGENIIQYRIHETNLEHIFTLISAFSAIASLLFILALLWYSSTLKKTS